MDDSTRFTLAKTSVLVAGVAGALVLTGCSGEPRTVSGILDDVKSVKGVREVSHYETKPKTKRVCVAKNEQGRCTSYANRPDGTKRVKVVDKLGKPALYCVELDGVNGKDDQWYKVSFSTYSKWADKQEGDTVKDMPYERSLISCKH